MNAFQLEQLKRQAVALVRQARQGTGELGAVVNSIWANTQRLTIEGRRADIAEAVREGSIGIRAALGTARQELLTGRADVDATLRDLRRVEPEVMATSAAVLSPILAGALEHPARLESTYRRRHGDLADRLVLERSAAVVLDGLAGTEEGTDFAERWRRLTEELAPTLPPAEAEALAHRDALDEMGRYLDAAQVVVEHEISALDPETEPTTSERIAAERHRATVNEYENGVALAV